MSRFYGWLTGNRGTTTRGGSRSSGIETKLNSTTGLSVVVSMLEFSDTEEIVHIEIRNTRGISYHASAFVIDKNEECREYYRKDKEK